MTSSGPFAPVPSNGTIAPTCLPDGESELQRYVNLSTFWYCFLALITTMGLVISLVSNMIIIYLFTKTRSLRQNPSNIIAVNLSLSDLLYCIQWPSVIYCSLTQSTVLLEYEIVCQSFGFITVSTALASILTVLAMSVERAIVIKYSIQAKNRFTIRSAWFITVIIWLVSLSSCLPPLFGRFNRYTLDPSKTSCTLDYLSPQSNYKLYILVLYVAFWIVPFALITISYILIIVTFGKSSLTLKQLANESELEHQLTRLYSNSSRRLGMTPTANNFADQQQSSSKPRSRFGLGRRLKDSLKLGTSSEKGRQEKEATDNKSISNLFCLSTELDSGRLDEQVEQARNCPEAAIKARRATVRRAASSSLLLDRPAVQRQRLRSSETIPPLMQQLDSSAGRSSLAARWRWARAISARELRPKMRFPNQCLNEPSGGSARASPGLVKQVSSNITNAANSQLTRAMLQFRLAKMSLYLILLWLVSWTPIASLAMLNSVVKCHRASATAVFLASTMTKLGPAFDVFIYGISHPRIKSKFKQIIKRLCMPLANSSDLGTQSTGVSRFSFRLNIKSTRTTKEQEGGRTISEAVRF